MQKQKTRFEALGDRMKAFEAAESERRFMPGLPIVVRLDGRSFHTFTKGMPRPYYEPMSKAMVETARYLVEVTQANFAYTQSDEITLVYYDVSGDSTGLFSGRVQKLVSVLAGTATAKFNQVVMQEMPERAYLLPVFDSRAFNVPNLSEVVNCLLFRTIDCAKNSITMAASAYYSHKELHGVGSSQKHDMLRAKGINWARDYPAFFKDGTFLQRRSILRELTEEELKKIPIEHRPKGPVVRRSVIELDMPTFSRVHNPIEALFFEQDAILKSGVFDNG